MRRLLELAALILFAPLWLPMLWLVMLTAEEGRW